MLNSEYDPETGLEELDAADKVVRKRLLTTEVSRNNVDWNKCV